MLRTLKSDLVCLSHLRWQFVFQRPQHLMVRFARERRVFYVEEPIADTAEPYLNVAAKDVCVLTPHLPASLSDAEQMRVIRRLLNAFFHSHGIEKPLLWLYTPMAWPLVDGLPSSAVVYDCMDELTGFAGASPELRSRERELMAAADVMFTGGHSLFDAKRALHSNIHPFPSSVDVRHFGRARKSRTQPPDQRAIPRPRIGYCGVIDERLDLDLLRGLALQHPEWQFVMIGPVAKIDSAALPRHPNLHYLGMKSYDDLPAYMAGWDAAILPFAHNSATRFISPTKTPEYLAAGCPVVSTSIRDVVRPYGERGMVEIADTVETCGEAIARALGPEGRRQVGKADAFLSTLSWDRTWSAMNDLVCAAESGGASVEKTVPVTAQPAAL